MPDIVHVSFRATNEHAAVLKQLYGCRCVGLVQGVLVLGVFENESECDGEGPTLARH